MNTDIFTRCDHHPIPENKQEVRLFLLVRNELNRRLPYFLKYYRKLGIRRFFVLDNDSDDATVEYLCKQSDCHVFSTTDNYKNHIAWINKLLNVYGVGHWCLCVDVDELFVYPESEQVSIQTFCTFLDQEEVDSVSSFLLDLYSDQNLDKVLYEAGTPFTEVCAYFDKDYTLLHRASSFRKLFKKSLSKEPFGGPRLRLFYPRWNKPTVFTTLAIAYMNKLGNILAWLGLENMHVNIQGPPRLYKNPLIKWRKGLVWHPHNPESSAVRLSEITTALLHFKFFSDFHDNAITESKREQHYAGAVEYKKYIRISKHTPNINFMYEGSTRYNGTASLVHHRLLRTSEAYQKYIAKLNNEEQTESASEN